MTEREVPVRVDHASRHLAAPADRVFRALTERDAVQSWLPPAGSRGIVHAFDPRAGGAFRLTLVFDTPGETGSRKSSSSTDVVDGEFLELIQNELVRQRFAFRSDDPSFAGAMVMTWRLTPTAIGTQVDLTAENDPVGISPHDHEVGMASSLENLAAYVE
jgi:uncharacterized protein YndB with AHSA1/START domain